MFHRSAIRCIIFNQQGEREAVELLEKLYNVIVAEGEYPCLFESMRWAIADFRNDIDKLKFDHVLFCTTAPRPDTTSKGMWIFA
jgi:hypothetical protein